MKKFISILLIICTLLGVVGCSNNDNQGSNPTPSAPVIDEVLTERYVLHNGLTDYKIVLPADSNDYERQAAGELSALFYEATGVNLETISDTGLTHNDSSKFISIGKTTLFNSSNIQIVEEAKQQDGFQITTKDNVIYIVGGNKHGVVFAVYEYLFRVVGFEQYSADCYYIEKAVVDIPLYNYTVVDSPDFPYAASFPGFMNLNASVSLRMKSPYTYANWVEIKKKGKPDHNALVYIDPTVYQAEHEEWFSYPDASQLCYQARGDIEEYDLLVETMVEECIKNMKLEENKGKFVLGISCMDNHNVCACPACIATKDMYGCDTAQLVWFMNDVHDKMMEWFETEDGKPYWNENFRITTSFYAEYVDAPAQLNEETGEWEPIDDSVVFRDRVIPNIAPYHTIFQLSLKHERNVTQYNRLKKLAAISSEIAIWWYNTTFSAYMFPYDCYSSMQENYAILKELGVKKIMDESQNGNDAGMTGFNMFKAFLSTRFFWNVNEDQEALTNRYFKGYFMDASEDMLKYYNSYRNFSQVQLNGLVPECGSLYCSLDLAKYWPKSVIDEWQGYIDSALDKIEKYKNTEPDTYDMLYKHITMERVFLDYVYLQFYKAELGSKYTAVRDRFIEGFRINNIMKTREGDALLEDYAKSLMED